MGSRLGRTRFVFAACFAALSVSVAAPRSAWADAGSSADVEAAGRAYDRGARAYDAGNYVEAAHELAKADALAPNKVALDLAIRAALKADDARLAVKLAVRAESRHDPKLADTARLAIDAMAGRTGRVTARCPVEGGATCSATLDGEGIAIGEPEVVLVGRHKIVFTAQRGDAKSNEIVWVTALADGDVDAPAHLPPLGPVGPVASSDATSGVSPTVFWVATGITAVLGAVTLVSALDTQAKHDDFLRTKSLDAQQHGMDAQLRTNILAGVTGAGLVATVALGAFVVTWGGPERGGAR